MGVDEGLWIVASAGLSDFAQALDGLVEWLLVVGLSYS